MKTIQDQVPFYMEEGVTDAESGPMSRLRSRLRTNKVLIFVVLAAVVVLARISSTQTDFATLHFSSPGVAETCAATDFKCKVDEAMSRYESMKARQSKNADEAIANYRVRYRRAPPPGFDEWLSYAFANNASIIDDYDRIEADLQPLRELRLSKDEIFARMSSAWDSNRFVSQATYSLGHITIRNGTYELAGHLQEDFTNTIRQILAPIAPKLPDLTILYNWFDEPRLILPTKEGKGSNEVEWEDFSHQSTWDALHRPCKRLSKTPAIDFPLSKEKDVCNMPAQSRNQHGLFYAPSNFHPSQSLFPMISNCKLSTMGDILGPSPSYFTEKYRRWSISDNTTFEQKSKTVYWRGSSTGMIMIHKHWTEGLRQRFNLQMRKLQEGVTAAKEIMKLTPSQMDHRTSIWPSWYKETNYGRKILSQLAAIPQEISKVGFSGFFHCDDMSCGEATAFLPLLPQEDVGESFKHQIVADLDGEGMSGRFYRLVASNSLPLKQTIWHEWHDERILPWVHYVPLSLQMDELAPLLGWILGTTEGQKYAASIAHEGNAWAAQSMRTVDASLYVYRLLLEYSQIFNGYQ